METLYTFADGNSMHISHRTQRAAPGGELFSRLAKDRGERRRRTEAGARSRSFVFCALDSRQLSFIQPVYPRQLSLVAYKTPLTPAKNELLTRATSASIRRLFPSLSTPRKASPPLVGSRNAPKKLCFGGNIRRMPNPKDAQACAPRVTAC